MLSYPADSYARSNVVPARAELGMRHEIVDAGHDAVRVHVPLLLTPCKKGVAEYRPKVVLCFTGECEVRG
jgi:hypothetical protein